MKRNLFLLKKFLSPVIALLLALGMSLGAVASVPEVTSNYINDFAGVLDADDRALLEHNAELFEAQTGIQYVLVSVDFTGTDDMAAYALELFNTWQIGSNDDGLLLLMSIGDDNYRVTTGTQLEKTLPSGDVGEILDRYLEPDFAAKDYSAGALKVSEALITRLNGTWAASLSDTGAAGGGQPSPQAGYNEPYQESGSSVFLIAGLFIFVVVIILIVLLARASWRGRYYPPGGAGPVVIISPRRRWFWGGGWFRRPPPPPPFGGHPPAGRSAPPRTPGSRPPSSPPGGGFTPGGGSSRGAGAGRSSTGGFGGGFRSGGGGFGGGGFRGGGGSSRGGGAGRR